MSERAFGVVVSGREHLEVWKPIPRFPGYEASNLGRVRSVDRVVRDGRSTVETRTRRGRILSQHLDQKGYPVVRPSIDGKATNKLVGRLVLFAFVGDPAPAQECCHRNGIPTDNRLENLRWGTHAENMANRTRRGTDSNSRKTQCPHGHPYDDTNTYVGRGGQRHCRACHRARQQRRRESAGAVC